MLSFNTQITESLQVKDKNTCTSNTGTGNTTPQTTNTGSHGHSSSDDTANHSQDGSTKQLSSSSSDAVSNEKGTTEEVVDMVTDENEIFKYCIVFSITISFIICFISREECTDEYVYYVYLYVC